jgi:hypothetical protein
MGEAGDMACLDNCAMKGIHSVFSHHRLLLGEALPRADEAVCDIAVLDMHHGWPNLGHNSIVQAVREAACDFEHAIRAAHLKIRVLSFDVRRLGLIPEPPGGRFSIYIGTGGPGHLDPRLNDGASEFSQGVREDPSWEPRAFRLFDDILADPGASFMAVCHSFGILCRWSGIAEPRQRGPEKGGKSAGVVENVLTESATAHPWFKGLAHDAGSLRIKVIDSRLFDLIPDPVAIRGVVPLSFEAPAGNGSAGDALTGVEFARDARGTMPRMFGFNHHPEIMEGGRQKLIIESLQKRKEVTRAWSEERMSVLSLSKRDPSVAQQLAITTGFTLVWPLRFHLVRNLRERALRLNRAFEMHEDAIIDQRFADRRARPRPQTAVVASALLSEP